MMKNMFIHFGMFAAVCALLLSNAMADDNSINSHTKHVLKNISLSTSTRFSILDDQFALGLGSTVS